MATLQFRWQISPISLRNLFIAASFCTVAVRVSVSITSLYFWPLKHTSCLKICYGLLCPDLQWLQSQLRTMISLRSQGKIWMPYKFVCVCADVYVFLYTHIFIHVVNMHSQIQLHLTFHKQLQMRLCMTHGCACISVHTGTLDTWTQKWDFSHSSLEV